MDCVAQELETCDLFWLRECFVESLNAGLLAQGQVPVVDRFCDSRWVCACFPLRGGKRGLFCIVGFDVFAVRLPN